MAEIRITFEPGTSPEKRYLQIRERQKDLKGNVIKSMKLEKIVEQVGNVITKMETADWQGLSAQRLMLKTASSFLIEFETVPEKQNRCKGCDYPIAKGNVYCGECLCEDDCGY